MKSLRKLYLALIYLFMYAPILVMAVYSFNNSTTKGSTWKGFTLDWYKQIFEDSEMLEALQTTLWTAILSAVIATVIGTFAAIGIHKMKKSSKAVVMNITRLPVVNPDIVTGVSLMILFVFIGLPLGKTSLLLSHISFNIPYVIISVLPKLSQFNNNMYEAALDLGASPLKAYSKIVVPEIMPGIMTGFLLALTLSIDDFVVSFFTAGAGATNLSIFIYSAVSKRYNPSINALSTLMFVTIFVLLLIVNFRTKKKDTIN